MALPETPMDPAIVKQEIKAMDLPSVGLASIRELNRIVLNIEKASGKPFIRMEMGVPGFEPPQIAIEAEIEALRKGVGAKYPPFDGIPDLKQEISLFIKNFLNIDIPAVFLFPHSGLHAGLLHGHDVHHKADQGQRQAVVH